MAGSAGPIRVRFATRSPARIEIPLQSGGLTLALFGHPLVRSLQTCKVGLLGDRARNPSYLAPATFARVLIDTLVPDDEGETTLVAVRATVEKLPDGLPAKSSLLACCAGPGTSWLISSAWSRPGTTST